MTNGLKQHGSEDPPLGRGPRTESTKSGPIGAVESAVLNGFTEVAGLDVLGRVEIGNGASDFEDAIVSSRVKRPKL